MGQYAQDFYIPRGGQNAKYLDILRGDPIASRMLGYVKDFLSPVDSMSKSGVRLPFRSRFAHIERVTGWALRLSETEGGDAGVIAIASIFHDAGYRYTGEGHAQRSATVFDAYAKTERVDIDDGKRADPAPEADKCEGASRLPAAIRSAMSSAKSHAKIRNAIALHSDKHLPETELDRETAILMDADKLDEAGAMAVLFDIFTESASPEFDYDSAYDRILARYGADADEAGRFHTAEGLRQYMIMRRYVREFLVGLGNELGRETTI